MLANSFPERSNSFMYHWQCMRVGLNISHIDHQFICFCSCFFRMFIFLILFAFCIYYICQMCKYVTYNILSYINFHIQLYVMYIGQCQKHTHLCIYILFCSSHVIFFLMYFFTEVWLIHNVTLVSGVQHSDSTSLYKSKVMFCSPQVQLPSVTI